MENSKFCRKCGNQLNINDEFCPKCGTSQSVNTTTVSSNRKCPRCGSTNLIYQRESVANIGGSTHSVSNQRKGCLHFLLIGWWMSIVKFVMLICTGGLSLLFRKKKSINGKSITANKTINRTMAVCQNCGNTWKV